MKNNIGAGRIILIVVHFLIFWLFFSPPAFAVENTAMFEKWQFEITPYFLAASMNGDTGIGGVTADIDMSFSDIWDKLGVGFMGAFEARKGPWIFAFDGIYVRLDDEKAKSWQGPLGIVSTTGELEATVTQQIYQLSAGYRLIDKLTKLDLIGAIRYTHLDVDLDLSNTTSGLLFPGGIRSLSGSEDWCDPVIGIRTISPFTKKWSFLGYADVGGFGVGSDFTFQVIAGIKWQFSRIVSAKLVYRYLHQKYEKDNFVWDMAFYGPMLGFCFTF